MNTVATLPTGYREWMKIDLQTNKKEMLLVNGMALVICVLLVIAGARAVPLSRLFAMGSLLRYFIRFAVLMVGIVAYILLHELVHGIFMRGFSGIRPTYGFTGLYAYAGSTAYFDKKRYLIVALAPVVIWGGVLAAVTAAVPEDWFWVFYWIQIANLSGAAGDLYVTWRLCRLPADILVNDTGVSMTVYGRDAD